MHTKGHKLIPTIIVKGLQLALMNALLIIAGGGVTFGMLYIAELLRRRGFFIPPPLWLVLLPMGIFYYIKWFRYGKAFAAQIGRRNFLGGLVVGLIGQIPGFILAYYLHGLRLEDMLFPEILRIGLVIIITFSLVLPLMVGLGATDKK